MFLCVDIMFATFMFQAEHECWALPKSEETAGQPGHRGSAGPRYKVILLSSVLVFDSIVGVWSRCCHCLFLSVIIWITNDNALPCDHEWLMCFCLPRRVAELFMFDFEISGIHLDDKLVRWSWCVLLNPECEHYQWYIQGINIKILNKVLPLSILPY